MRRIAIIGIAALGSYSAIAMALPETIANRLEDAIMDFGAKTIGGPFKKGGGDEAATRAVIQLIISPEDARKAYVKLLIQAESITATRVEDTPGYSQAHGVPMPVGAKWTGNVPRGTTPHGGVGLRISTAISSGYRDRATGAVTHDLRVGNSHSRNASDAANTPGHPNQIILEAGKQTYAQDKGNDQINPNPEIGRPPAVETPSPAQTPPHEASHEHPGKDGGVTVHDRPTRADFDRSDRFDHFTHDG